MNWLVRSCVCVLSLVWLCNPMDYSLQGSYIHGIFQARILEWVAISYSRESFWPRDEPASLSSPALAGGFFTTASCETITCRIKNRSKGVLDARGPCSAPSLISHHPLQLCLPHKLGFITVLMLTGKLILTHNLCFCCCFRLTCPPAVNP